MAYIMWVIKWRTTVCTFL